MFQGTGSVKSVLMGFALAVSSFLISYIAEIIILRSKDRINDRNLNVTGT